MDDCDHIWLYIGSKRQQIWRCTRCDEYRLDDPTKEREWVGLTDEEVSQLWDEHIVPVFDKNGINPIVFARAIEAKLKEKNT